MIKAMTGGVGFGPVVEKPYDNRGLPSILDGLPEIKLKSGLIKKIPLLTGVVKHETANGFLLNKVRDKFVSATEFLKTVSGGLNLGKLVPKIEIPGTGKMKSSNSVSNHKKISVVREHITTSRLFECT